MRYIPINKQFNNVGSVYFSVCRFIKDLKFHLMGKAGGVEVEGFVVCSSFLSKVEDCDVIQFHVFKKHIR